MSFCLTPVSGGNGESAFAGTKVLLFYEVCKFIVIFYHYCPLKKQIPTKTLQAQSTRRHKPKKHGFIESRQKGREGIVRQVR